MEVNYIIGIDPGNTGAIVVLNAETLVPTHWIRIPTMTVGKSNRTNCAAVAKFLTDIGVDKIKEAVVEAVHAMPGQGVTSMFTFGYSAGSLDGVVAALGIPTTKITPQKWKQKAQLVGKDKDAARVRAIQMWPQWNVLSKKGEGQALADAALIARFGNIYIS